ncbi:prolipoprotein diacylglyceryl transferase [Changchengzhania lutea]|uniref:prolipoprotein diacylglyceryl transferase n=1 Tax=Changchengzhania lutea TaxID=2049305 RepID=UPI00115E2773|nr:prolipoprotein diacylglyceryl transferase [Changchengzhania lutea]
MIFSLLFFLNYFFWEPNIYIFQIDGFKLKWYSILFALGFFTGRFIIFYIYKKEQKFHPSIDIQLIFMVIGTLIGARMGHVLFYQTNLLYSDFFELFKFWKGGLSSHGTAFGVLFSMSFYSYALKIKGFKIQIRDKLKHGNTYLQVLDRMVIVIALGAVFIRFGNFVNSEIIGKPTASNYGVIQLNPFTDKLKQTLPFVEAATYNKTERFLSPGYPVLDIMIQFKNQKYYEQRIRAGVDRLLLKMMPTREGQSSHVINPKGSDLGYKFIRTNKAFYLSFEAVGVVRHPVQLYESFTNLLIFILFYWIWYRKKEKLQPGFLLGLFMVILFSIRIFHEVFKENQVSFENQMSLNMGQLLSLPFIVLGLIILSVAIFSKKETSYR